MLFVSLHPSFAGSAPVNDNPHNTNIYSGDDPVERRIQPQKLRKFMPRFDFPNGPYPDGRSKAADKSGRNCQGYHFCTMAPFCSRHGSTGTWVAWEMFEVCDIDFCGDYVNNAVTAPPYSNSMVGLNFSNLPSLKNSATAGAHGVESRLAMLQSKRRTTNHHV